MDKRPNVGEVVTSQESPRKIKNMHREEKSLYFGKRELIGFAITDIEIYVVIESYQDLRNLRAIRMWGI